MIIKLSKPVLRTAGIFISCLLILGLGLGLYLHYLRSSLQAELTDHLTTVAKQSVHILNTQIQGDINSLLSAADAISAYSDGNMENQPWEPILQEARSHNDFARMGFAQPNGVAYVSDGFLIDISHRDYFQKALAGENTVSDPLPDAVDTGKAILLAVPVKSSDTISGVLFAAHPIQLYRSLIATDSFNGQGHSLVIKANGEKVAFSPAVDLDKQTNNIFESRLNTLLDVDGSMRQDLKNGKSGTARFYRPGHGWLYISYEPVGINDWYLLSVVPAAVAAQKTKNLLLLSLILCVTGLLVFMGLLSYIYLQNRQTRKALYQAAYTDPITRRPNWPKTRQQINPLLQKQTDKHYAFVVFSINKFHWIHERIGLDKAHKLLRHIASLLDEELKEGEIGSRVHDDVFQMLLQYNSPEQLKNRLTLLNEKITNWPLLQEDRFQMIISFGVYLLQQEDKLSAAEMLSRAILARNTVRGNYSNIIAFYDEDFHRQVQQEQNLESRMEEAVTKREFSLRLIPIKNFDLELTNVQATLVWRQKDGTDLEEKGFRRIFTKNGFIARLDIYKAEAVCRLLQTLRKNGKKTIPVLLEVSADSLSSPYFATVLGQLTRKYEVKAADLILQLTPLAETIDLPLLTRLMYRLQKEGYKLALNHFSAGDMSMDLLKTLPCELLKVEGVFLTDLQENIRTQKIVVSYIRMAQELGAQTLFSNVETQMQWDVLRTLGAQFCSGSAVGAILDEGDLAAHLPPQSAE